MRRDALNSQLRHYYRYGPQRGSDSAAKKLCLPLPVHCPTQSKRSSLLRSFLFVLYILVGSKSGRAECARPNHFANLFIRIHEHQSRQAACAYGALVRLPILPPHAECVWDTGAIMYWAWLPACRTHTPHRRRRPRHSAACEYVNAANVKFDWEKFTRNTSEKLHNNSSGMLAMIPVSIPFENISDFEEIHYHMYAILRTVSMMNIDNERFIASDFTRSVDISMGDSVFWTEPWPTKFSTKKAKVARQVKQKSKEKLLIFSSAEVRRRLEWDS